MKVVAWGPKGKVAWREVSSARVVVSSVSSAFDRHSVSKFSRAGRAGSKEVALNGQHALESSMKLVSLPASSWQRKYDFLHFFCQLLATSRKNLRLFTIYLPAPGNLCEYFLFFALKLLASSWLETRPKVVMKFQVNRRRERIWGLLQGFPPFPSPSLEAPFPFSLAT